MRPQNEVARERLEVELRRAPPVSAAELSKRLKVSLPTMLRILHEREERVFRIGTTKTARYALRRPLRGIAKPIPVYRIDRQGKGHSCGTLELVEPQGSFIDLKAMGWPTGKNTYNGWWDGLPYPLHDMRPQGFLGRNFARGVYQDLGVSPNPEEWSDDDIVYVLTRYGSDTSGNLIVGDQAYSSWLSSVANPQSLVSDEGLYGHYMNQASLVTSQVGTGSSAAGEFPKFTASRSLPGSATPHVIVKFSGADDSTAVRRWSDLLICEHLALTTLGRHTDLEAASSRILNEPKGRTFLEVERFDRHDILGRSETITLATLTAALLGSGKSTWPELVHELARLKLTAPSVEEKVRVLWWYGKLIANTDMHLGNLSFRLSPLVSGAHTQLQLTPAYDMLPMLYAPLSGGEVPIRAFEPALPLPREREAWRIACGAAILFWETASGDPRVSSQFQILCTGHMNRLNALSHRV